MRANMDYEFLKHFGLDTKLPIFMVIFILVVISIMAFPKGNHLDTLANSRLGILFYDEDDIPKNMKEIVTHDFGIDPLIEFYKKEKDDLIKFNVVAIVNEKIQINQFANESDKVKSLLDLALADKNPWIRSEAVDAAEHFNPALYKGRILELINDKYLIVALCSYNYAFDKLPFAELQSFRDGIDEERLKEIVTMHDSQSKVDANSIALKELMAYKANRK